MLLFASIMLDPRSLAERRAEIEESCRKRRVKVDLTAAIAAHEAVTSLQTEQNEQNRLRNEHQKSGKQKLEAEQREAHNAEGRRLKEAVAALELAIDHPSAGVVQIHMAGRALQQQGQMEAANDVFRKNYEKNAGQWPVDFGMARVYSQEGDFKKALET